MTGKDFIFFSANDFAKDGGGTIRMLGIMNELAEKGHPVTFISNTTRFELFHPSIKHVQINFRINPKAKRTMQSIIGFASPFLLNWFFRPLFQRLKYLFIPYKNSTVYFFEYLDNSIGYWLNRNGLIGGYINDLHGVAVLEFDYQYRTADSGKKKIALYFKYLGAKFLDYKVFKKAQGLIYASKAMQNYYWQSIPCTRAKKSYILPYVLDKKQLNTDVDFDLQQSLKQRFKISETDKVIFFAGVFKKTGGVPDLIRAISMLNDKRLKLLLVGDGPTYKECEEIIQAQGMDNIYLAGRVPYKDLRTYQSIANIIVCPDRDNVYSQLIIHVKYLDALIAEKIVVNGAFESVKEINQDEKLSLMFIPSDVESLAKAIQRGLENESLLLKKYQGNIEYIRQHLTYSTAINVLLEEAELSLPNRSLR
ncbi:glycosyltransferase family 4 protein [Terrimonas pollutisoli]|uniref:glycosyltransferase family 4 protein n=1 Tax=Terrimonas pollutisoli TaxID=3034147 RepID=UPI0023EC52A9|nr:glycosyltransferase family 4 protein [Terrimonas sp. H1YJ31]